MAAMLDDSNDHPLPAPEAVVHWLEAMAHDHKLLAELDEEMLIRLRKAAGNISRPGPDDRHALSRLRRRKRKGARRAADDAAVQATSNRAMKRALRFPVAPPQLAISSQHRELLEKQADKAHLANPGAPKFLEQERDCYICKVAFSELHHHYDSICPACAQLNWIKRNQSADLSGRVALVTGSRVKIGFEICLLLLRSGAQVIATTRFPADSARRFSGQPDFEEWQTRLQIHALDLRHTPSVETFAQHLVDRHSRLDFLIHNACQTVRRPPAYYDHLVQEEAHEKLSLAQASLLDDHRELIQSLKQTSLAAESKDALQPVSNSPSNAGLTESSKLSQMDLLSEAGQQHLFPGGMLDGEGSQLDLRDMNSWRLDLHQVPTVELLEVQLV
ncbi:MAG: hypothetical protein ACI87O_000354, partial [Planctomycetota bacterium]